MACYHYEYSYDALGHSCDGKTFGSHCIHIFLQGVRQLYIPKTLAVNTIKHYSQVEKYYKFEIPW